jgi:hypothetical protein
MAAPILPAFYLNKLLALLLYRVQTDENTVRFNLFSRCRNNNKSVTRMDVLK